jgi:hypothetical protein
MHLEETRLTLWQRLRRPSTLALLGAGLLAADLLRRLAAWTDATFAALLAGAVVALLALWRLRRPARHARSRETVAVLLTNAAKPLCDPRLARPEPRDGLAYRIVLFVLLVAMLVMVPALVGRVTS